MKQSTLFQHFDVEGDMSQSLINPIGVSKHLLKRTGKKNVLRDKRLLFRVVAVQVRAFFKLAP